MPCVSAAAPALNVEEAQQLEDLSRLLRAVADEKRLKMLYLLLPGELCVCKIMAALGISQALASHHLAVLRDAGLVRDRRDARWVYYSLNPAAFRELQGLMARLGRPAGPRAQRRGLRLSPTGGSR